MVTCQLIVKTENPPSIVGGIWSVLRGHSILEFYSERDGAAPDWIKNVMDILRNRDVEFYFRLSESESGGGMTNTGSATIPVNKNGDQLKGFYTRKLSNGEGYKAFGNPIVVVCASHHRRDFSFNITLYYIDKEGNVETRELWRFAGSVDAIITSDELENIVPMKCDKFIPALRAAMEMATCYHCRETHFY